MTQEDFPVTSKSFIRTDLEYCVQSWNPHFVRDEVLEKVQRRAAKCVKCMKSTVCRKVTSFTIDNTEQTDAELELEVI